MEYESEEKMPNIKHVLYVIPKDKAVEYGLGDITRDIVRGIAKNVDELNNMSNTLNQNQFQKRKEEILAQYKGSYKYFNKMYTSCFANYLYENCTSTITKEGQSFSCSNDASIENFIWDIEIERPFFYIKVLSENQF